MWCYSRNISIWGKNLSIWDGISKPEDITKNESNVRSGGCSSIIIQPFELWWGLKLIGFLIVKSALSGVMLGPQCTAGFACHVFFEETIRNWKFVCGYTYNIFLYMIVYTLVINSLCDTNTTCFLFSLCTYTYVYICITHDTWTFVASQIPAGNAGSLWLGSKLGCPLVNVYTAMERSTIVHGTFHYFDWVIFNSYVTQSLPEGTHSTFGWSFPHVI